MTEPSPHLHDEIPRLLTGDADRETVHAAVAHLRSCADCTDELIAAVSAHASLTSAARFAPEVVRGVTRETPPAQDADRVAAPRPDLSAVFAQIRAETAEEAETADAGSGASAAAAQRRPGFAARRLTLAAAAVVLVGAGAGGVYAADHLSSPSSHTVRISAYGIGRTSGTATVVGSNELKVNASSLPAASTGQYYEVWLTDSHRNYLAPMGPLSPDGKGEFKVSQTMLDTYSAIEVSVQNAQSSGAYSGVSVLRGSYR